MSKTLPGGGFFQVGIDLAETERIEQTLTKFGERFKEKHYSRAEIEYCDGKRHPFMHYAGRWAAKEAFLKAVGIGILRGVSMSGLSLIPPPGRTRPLLTVCPEAQAVLDRLTVQSWDINITHSRGTALAVAMVVFREDPDEKIRAYHEARRGED